MSDRTTRKANIMVLGASGMLGRAVVGAATAKGHRVTAVRHSDADLTYGPDVFTLFRGITPAPDCIINCAGGIPERHAGRDAQARMIAVNALAPHLIARYANDGRIWPNVPPPRVLHVSTDCVFSGDPEMRFPAWSYDVGRAPDPVDLYGRSKLTGEVSADHVTNVRTSFIGPDHGLWRWLADAAARGDATVEGWAQAWWTGSTVQAVAAALVDMAASGVPLVNIVHLATVQKISKHMVLTQLRDHLGLDIAIGPKNQPRIDRALTPTMTLSPLWEALAALRAEKAAAV